jgi:predicted GIY-YIG superfamily endonuclease
VSTTTIEARPTSLYRLFDADGSLLYVGISYDPWRRIREHMDKTWWSQVAQARIEKLPSRGHAIDAEARAIRSEHPRWNVAGARTSSVVDFTPGEFAMLADTARMFGVTRQAVDLWSRNPEAGFPAPVDTASGGRVWRTADVARWAKEKGREIRE